MQEHVETREPGLRVGLEAGEHDPVDELRRNQRVQGVRLRGGAVPKHDHARVAFRSAPHEVLERADRQVHALVDAEVPDGTDQQRAILRPHQAARARAQLGVRSEPGQVDAQRDARHLARRAIVALDVVPAAFLGSGHHRTHAQADHGVAQAIAEARGFEAAAAVKGHQQQWSAPRHGKRRHCRAGRIVRVHHVDRLFAAIGGQPPQRAQVEHPLAVQVEAARVHGALVRPAAEFFQASKVVADAKAAEAFGERRDRLPPSAVAVGQGQVEDVHRLAGGCRPFVRNSVVLTEIGGVDVRRK